MEELKPLTPHLYYEVKIEPAVLAPEPKIEDEKQKYIEIDKKIKL